MVNQFQAWRMSEKRDVSAVSDVTQQSNLKNQQLTDASPRHQFYTVLEV